jgi:hypothetical protein
LEEVTFVLKRDGERVAVDESRTIKAVAQFLNLCERRQLAEATQYLAPGAVMVFPGNTVYRRLEDMAAASALRYKTILKPDKTFDFFARPDGTMGVICTGTLAGINLHGVEFSGVRFIDRFLIRDGKIVEQQVWNDVAHLGVLDAKP